MINRNAVSSLLLLCSLAVGAANPATLKVVKLTLNTYPFSDPDPVPKPGRLYPYFRFDGFTHRGEPQPWEMIVMENDYIQVTVSPQIGGKVWGAIEKSTGKAFVYFNHAVKFRDIAMRGPWTSGGLEYNFGDIGHIPSCATPVDYATEILPDGGVACTVGAYDWPSRTRWSVRIVLPADKPYFQTVASWFNTSPLPVTYYHWMNAAAKTDGGLEFFYPGDKTIGHAGEVGEWPMVNGQNAALYDQNDFGSYKSYHVLNSYADHFGGYWHDEAFGFGHLADFDEKPGKKLWIWSLSDEGRIWRDLLTDHDGQYIEYQAGKLFNQAVEKSSLTPFKHREFPAYAGDVMKETWFPFKGTGGLTTASPWAVLKVERRGDQVELKICALQRLDCGLLVKTGDQPLLDEALRLEPLGLHQTRFDCPPESDFELELGDELLRYSSSARDHQIDRPLEAEVPMRWDSAHGLYLQALELEKQRQTDQAMQRYQMCLDIDPSFLPALSRKALGHLRRMEPDKAADGARKALSIDSYDPLANYVLGLASRDLGQSTQAKNALSIAAYSLEYRSAALTTLAEIFLSNGELRKARSYAQKALESGRQNPAALEIQALAHRRAGEEGQALETLDELSRLDPLNPLLAYERLTLKQSTPDAFRKRFQHELPQEGYLELALRYLSLGGKEEAKSLLRLAPKHPMVLLWRAHLEPEDGQRLLAQALALPTTMVFPHRVESASMLQSHLKTNSHWKLNYYLGLIHWQKDQIERARELFLACGNKPDAAPFYMAKRALFKENETIGQQALQMAHRLAPSDWRVNLAWMERLLTQGAHEEAERIGRTTLERHPENPLLTLSYAQVLLKMGHCDQALGFLESRKILPFEGATEARWLYHEIAIMAALKRYRAGDFAGALNRIDKARQWPENLGVGRPYEADERLCDLLGARVLSRRGWTEQSRLHLNRIRTYQPAHGQSETANLLLTALVLHHSGRKGEAQKRVEEMKNRAKDNPAMEWVAQGLSQMETDSGLRSFLLKAGRDMERSTRLIGLVLSEIDYDWIGETK